jgi:murein DD-endopeptidase MepM/ murein hydrolase activator NlpD
MKIILLKESSRAPGQTLSVCLGRLHLTGAALLLISLLILTTFLAATQWPIASSDEALIAQWRERLAVQSAELEALRKKSVLESEAVGRQLAAMQARLMRMEALGSRVAEAAGLDDGEFSFDQPVPVGGPVTLRERALDPADLQTSLLGLSRQIHKRGSHLNHLESLLHDREFHERITVGGLPVARGWMSSKFGQRVDPFTGRMSWHAGVDFAGRAGSPVIAAGRGVVSYAGNRKGYGLMVEITHADGYVTRYAHQKSLAVASGDLVVKGQTIGAIGSSGRSTGPHVHFEVMKNGRHVDPRAYVARR